MCSGTGQTPDSNKKPSTCLRCAGTGNEPENLSEITIVIRAFLSPITMKWVNLFDVQSRQKVHISQVAEVLKDITEHIENMDMIELPERPKPM